MTQSVSIHELGSVYSNVLRNDQSRYLFIYLVKPVDCPCI